VVASTEVKGRWGVVASAVVKVATSYGVVEPTGVKAAKSYGVVASAVVKVATSYGVVEPTGVKAATS
jgi:hypothetical protein